MHTPEENKNISNHLFLSFQENPADYLPTLFSWNSFDSTKYQV
ncbi:hypothetical protein AHMF7616_04525 [Adhaeribacter pallidiroseus]|uniref:Uncharacterized protein n=1 Tax=Adhaeribacter pallidiroseus TaxID=2072847 RepID=A0A369QMD8_9BACT|nr:hypothetical protein AHMF7616_04525 [Adhaeribacter pallidiroseus]